jgi:ABC-type branched-subunit amino acid transport system ATPase component
VLSQRGLQQPANFVTKVVQMYDTMCVRFGLMLVGPTGGGKTTCCGTLQGALTHLRKEMNHPNEQFQVGWPAASRVGEGGMRYTFACSQVLAKALLSKKEG